MADKEKTKVDELRDALKAQKEVASRQSPVDSQAEVAGDQRPETGDAVASQLRVAEEEAKAHYDKLLRVMAEFENFKKRTERERIESIQFANQRLLEDLLPVIDHLDEALANVQIATNGGDTLRGLSEGVELTRRQFVGILAKHGLEPIEPEAGTPFDPSQHEAMAQVDAEGLAPGMIVARYRRGYKLNGRIIRAALVSVAK